MPISATRRLMTGGGWATPSFDIKDTVLYAPLWRPDMVARGGSIKNGTGTMDVTPQNLAVGANTITVTAAGTLIVAMPEGGTVASGTMTVTGSPVTVSAGIQTTITTTGAIGNITVTPSNIIRSKDRNNHALTVNGATWGIQGRTFDEVDDKITTPITTPITLTTQFGIGFWVKRGTDTANRTIIQARTGGNSWQINANTNGVGKIYFSKWTAAVEDAASTSTGTIALNTWAFVFFTYDSVAGSVTYFNGVVDRTDAISGVIDSVATTLDFGTACGSVIGKYIIYNNRVPSAQLVQQIYLATKWRYV